MAIKKLNTLSAQRKYKLVNKHFVTWMAMLMASKSVFPKLYIFMPHHNTSKFLNGPLIFNIPYLRKYQNVQKNWVFLDCFVKIVFCHFLRKYQYSRKSYFSLDLFEKICFLSICPKHSTFRAKWQHFKITFEMLFFAHISKNINISRKTTLF